MNTFKPKFYTDSDFARLSEDELVYPYSDKYSTYLPDKHQYELTKSYFLERGVDLDKQLDGNEPEKVKHFLAYLRNKMYLKIYTRSRSTRSQLNYMIAKKGLHGYTMAEYRDAFLETMFLEGVYLLDNGDISSVTGVDLDTMQNMSADVIRTQERDFHKDVLASLTELGLGFRGRYRFLAKGQGVDW